MADRCASIRSNSRDVESTLKIVEARFDFLVELVKKIEEETKKENFIDQAVKLRNHYRELSARDFGSPGIRLFDHLWRLSRRGLRDIIDQMSRYSWIEHGSEDKVELNWRFNGHYSPSILAYVLGGRRRYQQFASSVPNLYLINAPAPSNEYAVPKEFKSRISAPFG